MKDQLLEERKKDFKRIFFPSNHEEIELSITHEREKYAIKLRKETKNKEIEYKRIKNMCADNSEITEKMETYLNKYNTEKLPPISSVFFLIFLYFKDLRLSKLSNLLNFPMINEEYLYGILVALRLEVTIDHSKPIDFLINAGVIPKLGLVLSNVSNIEILCEATWILINISAHGSEGVKIMRNLGFQYKLIELMKLENSELQINVFF